jgi:hypothetical protein
MLLLLLLLLLLPLQLFQLHRTSHRILNDFQRRSSLLLHFQILHPPIALFGQLFLALGKRRTSLSEIEDENWRENGGKG